MAAVQPALVRSNHTAYINQLPPELLTKIFSFFDTPSQLYPVALTCKLFRKITDMDMLWALFAKNLGFCCDGHHWTKEKLSTDIARIVHIIPSNNQNDSRSNLTKFLELKKPKNDLCQNTNNLCQLDFYFSFNIKDLKPREFLAFIRAGAKPLADLCIRPAAWRTFEDAYSQPLLDAIEAKYSHQHIEILISKGAKFDTASKNPIDRAIEYKRSNKVLLTLLNHPDAQAEEHTLDNAIEAGYSEEVIDRLIDLKAPPPEHQRDLWATLDRVVSKPYSEKVAQYILDQISPLQTQTEFVITTKTYPEKSILDKTIAKKRYSDQLVISLLKKGLKPSFFTSLHFAKKNNRSSDLINLLKGHGAT